MAEESKLIPMDDRDGVIWFNGELVPWRDAKVHVLTHGLHYGSCVFEGARIYNGIPFKLQQHNERLHNSAKMLDFEIPYTVEELNKATLETIEAQGIKDGYLRPVAWLGSQEMGVSTTKSEVQTAIAIWEWPAYYGDEAKLEGMKLTWSDWQRPSPESAPTAAKAAGLYMICSVSKNKAEREGYSDAMMLDYRGYVAEATSANFFMVVNGELHTPTPDCFLNGITRQTIIELAKNKGINVIERHIKPEELVDGEQAFLTGSAAEVTPIASITGRHGDFNFEVGEIVIDLMNEYKELTKTYVFVGTEAA